MFGYVTPDDDRIGKKALFKIHVCINLTLSRFSDNFLFFSPPKKENYFGKAIRKTVKIFETTAANEEYNFYGYRDRDSY